MVLMDSLRFVFTLAVAFAVLGQQGSLPAPDEVRNVMGTRTGLYVLLLIATLLRGCAEVLRDNCGQTFMPSIVPPEHLERANGQMWAAESVANTFIGPPIGSLLLLAAFSMPFFIDAGSFFAAAALVAMIPGAFRAVRPETEVAVVGNWRTELAEGVRWLWGNKLLRAMAIILGLMNMASNISGAMFVLFSQDVLKVTPLTFTLMGFGFAIGATLGSYLAPWMSRTFGSGTCLAITLGSTAVTQFLVGLSSWWPLVGIVFAVGTLLGSTDLAGWWARSAHYLINWLFIILTTIHVYLSVTEDFPAFLDFFGMGGAEHHEEEEHHVDLGYEETPALAGSERS